MLVDISSCLVRANGLQVEVAVMDKEVLWITRKFVVQLRGRGQ